MRRARERCRCGEVDNGTFYTSPPYGSAHPVACDATGIGAVLARIVVEAAKGTRLCFALIVPICRLSASSQATGMPRESLPK